MLGIRQKLTCTEQVETFHTFTTFSTEFSAILQPIRSRPADISVYLKTLKFISVFSCHPHESDENGHRKTEVFENNGRWIQPRNVIVYFSKSSATSFRFHDTGDEVESSVFRSGVHTRTRKRRFQNFPWLYRPFFVMAFSVTVFTGYVWTEGQYVKKKLRYQTKMDSCRTWP